MSATAAIYQAIYSVLSADTTLAGLSLTVDSPTVSVYNNEPQNVLYPHVLLSQPTELPDHTFGTATTGLGWKDTIRIHVYSRYRGDLEVLGIHARIVTLLNHQPLTVTGFPQVYVSCERQHVLVEPKDKMTVRHLIGDFTVAVHQ